MFSSCFGVTQPLVNVSERPSQQKTGIDSPVTVDPALVLVDGDLSGLTKLALQDLNALVLASCGLAGGAVVGTDLCEYVSIRYFFLFVNHRKRYRDDKAL